MSAIGQQKRALGLVLLPLVLACGSQPQSDTIDGVEQAINEVMLRYSIPGLSVTILMDSVVTFSRAYGFADLEHGVPATPDTRFRTASIAKTLTSTAVLQLHEQGSLDLDAPIQDRCPAFPEKRAPVSARHLLGHLSGVRHYRSGEANGTEHWFSIESSLDQFKDDSLLFEPGTGFTYSTFGFSVLGCAIEGASEMSYGTYLAEHILVPAGMNATALDDHFLLREGRASGYLRVDQSDLDELPPPFAAQLQPGQVLNAVLHDTSMKIPGGGLLSTTEDLIRFVQAIKAGSLLADDTREMMWSSPLLSSGGASGYALGWDLDDIGGQEAVFHTGSQAGARGGLYVFPESGLAVAILSNLTNWPIEDLIVRIVEAHASLSS